MSALSGLMDDTGTIRTDGAGAIVSYRNGLPMTGAGKLCIGAGPITFYHQGLPFNAAGRVVTSAGSTAGYFSAGVPFSNLNQAIVTNTIGDRIEGGMPYTVANQIAATA